MDIKFSRRYRKLGVSGVPGAVVGRAVLLQVVKLDIRDLSKHFLAYDTDNNAYPLPSRGDVLLLIFRKWAGSEPVSHDLFTTIRVAKPGKEGYYKKCVGRTFTVVAPPSSGKPEEPLPVTKDSADVSPDTSVSESPKPEAVGTTPSSESGSTEKKRKPGRPKKQPAPVDNPGLSKPPF